MGRVPCAMFLFTCACAASEAEAAEVKSPLTSLAQHFSQCPCDEGRPADEMQPERATETCRLKSPSAESWPEVQPQSQSNMNDLLAFSLLPVSCIRDDGADESRNIWTFWISGATVEIYNRAYLIRVRVRGQGKEPVNAFCPWNMNRGCTVASIKYIACVCQMKYCLRCRCRPSVWASIKTRALECCVNSADGPRMSPRSSEVVRTPRCEQPAPAWKQPPAKWQKREICRSAAVKLQN